ncbi:MAG: ATP-dependent Clp protease proteolytic subunit [Terrisporobacter othiniensis]|uniref:ATP-dependent Clp protease proteolytic subunit n=2 Tax=Peptostreptococcaceae TaxID=186804 RepID=A0AAX2ZC82_9FIRM|nr:MULTISPECIES: ATP-dependent Clp protease proteolytic subunit [Terrisporobacter]MDU4859690.1 ATP-dependent Clp protease proteolytic subunit [Terrisporobacter othiniensis]MDU6994141.1 ATP-dependent Clp protease proteolytic subunit [Terrisporobacter othiniensis]UEL46973.1 ATP-dependent Clp protease proteolytic subunit [Terrisporobacter hibernicus]SFJ05426.1 ATP-dependent protease ClpP, protease subunit [Terrisporobacter glycolicus]
MTKKENNMNEYINGNNYNNYDLNQLGLEDKKEDEGKNKPDNNESNNVDNSNNEGEDEDSDKVQDIKQMGVPNMPSNAQKEIQCITIIGEIEGHFVGNPQKKSTKYEHIIPLLYSVEESNEIKGILVILNTVGGDVEAGLAMAELINSISKKVVTLVLGGSHSIGVPLATAGDYSYIAPTATMIVHPIRTNGLVIGVNETFEYFKKMQERIVEFITRTSNIEREELNKLMHAKDELVSDVGSVLIGKEAVECGLIDEVGGLKEALVKLRELIREDNKNEGNK